MYYIKWNNNRTGYEVWFGPSLGPTAMTTKGYERVGRLPAIHPEEPALTGLVFSKYKVAQKLMELGIWESVKAGLSESQKDFLYLAQDFSLNDANFAALYEQLKPQIPNMDVLLRECVL